MKTAIAMAVAIVAVTTLGIHAQSTPASVSASASAKPITVSGCVQRDATAGASAFRLTDVMDASKAGAAASSATTESGATRAASPTASSAATLLDEYSLQADSNINLAQQVNHKVEVIGTLTPSTSSPAMPINGPALKVTSVRMLASSCQ